MAACCVEAVQKPAQGIFQFLHAVEKLCSRRCKRHAQTDNPGALTLTRLDWSGAIAGLMTLQQQKLKQ